MAGNSNEPGRTVTSKLAAILVAFTNGRDYTLSELAMHTNLAISTVHRLLSDLVRTSLIERPDGSTYRPGPTLRELPYVVEAADAARAGAVRRGGPGGVAAHDRPPGHRRRPRGGLRREEARAGTRHAVPQPRQAAAARDGHGQGAARLRVTLAGPGPRRLRPSAVHPQDPRRPDRSRARPPEDQDPRLRPRGQRAPRRGSGAVAVPVFDVHGRSIAAIEVEVTPGRARGRARRSRVADGRTLPSPGDHPRGAPAPSRRAARTPRDRAGSQSGCRLEAGVRTHGVVSPRRAARRPHGRARRPRRPAGIRRSPRR